jgi:hypothetical protein
MQHIPGFHDLICIELNRMMASLKALSVPAKTNRNLWVTYNADERKFFQDLREVAHMSPHHEFRTHRTAITRHGYRRPSVLAKSRNAPSPASSVNPFLLANAAGMIQLSRARSVEARRSDYLWIA